MSDAFRVKMDIDIGNLSFQSGLADKKVKEGDELVDAKRTPSEVFALLVKLAILGANKQVSLPQLKACQGLIAEVERSAPSNEFVASERDLALIKASIERNPGWPNMGEYMGVLDQVLDRVQNAEAVE
jgi:hypothetical protein